MNYRKRQKAKPIKVQTQLQEKTKSRFMAMSKLIGFICMFVLLAVIIYSLYEMHVTKDLSNLSQLIICSFGLTSVYVGFYITMAKVEHIEEERSRCKKELEQLKLKNCEGKEDEIEMYKENISNLQQQLNNIIQQDNRSLL